MSANWHQLSSEQAAKQLGVDPVRGLEPGEAARRLREHGPNELQEKAGKNPLRLLAEQFLSTMVLILIAAAALSAALGKSAEAAAILGIVVMFAVLGFLQEYRAERAMAALRKLAVPLVRVRRGRAVKEVSARELVPGDVVLLEAGNIVPADLRLAEAFNLRIQEAALTGESEAVEKEVQVLPPGRPAGGRPAEHGLLGHGSVLRPRNGAGECHRHGHGAGAHRRADPAGPRIGHPAAAQARPPGRLLALCGAVVAAAVLGIGLAIREPLLDMVLTALSVAVAVVPEGLPAVVTITLSIGAQRMLRKRALIRRLPAVETLGSVTVICSDKTGTLTENRMTVRVVDVAGHVLQLSETLRHRQPVGARAGSRAGPNWPPCRLKSRWCWLPGSCATTPCCGARAASSRRSAIRPKGRC